GTRWRTTGRPSGSDAPDPSGPARRTPGTGRRPAGGRSRGCGAQWAPPHLDESPRLMARGLLAGRGAPWRGPARPGGAPGPAALEVGHAERPVELPAGAAAPRADEFPELPTVQAGP